MRLVVILAVAAAAALTATCIASARSQVGCQSSMDVSGKNLIVIGTNVGCAEAKPIVRGLVGAPTIGTVRIGRLTLLRLRSPRAGWKCITSTPVRAAGAGCSKTGTRKKVIYVNTSAG